MKKRFTLLSAILPAIFFFAFQYSATAQYCASTASAATTDEWITNVTFAGINNPSGNSGYSNFTSITANVTAGQSYPITVAVFNSSTIAWTETVRVWIDWNQNQIFETSEQYNIGSQSVPGGSTVNFTSNIAVPAGALSGTTRMRVTNRFSTYAGPCDTFTFGEVEDYGVNVGGSGPPPPPPPPPMTGPCDMALPLLCGQTVTGSTLNSAIAQAPTCGLVFPRYGNWYTLVGTGLSITLSTCGGATNYDTQIGVYSGSCAALVCVAGNNNDGACSNRRASTVTFSSVSGTTYYVWVTGVLDSRGSYTLSATCESSVTCNCSNTTPYLSVNAPTTSTPLTISGCTFAREYNTINNAVAGRTYRVTSSIATDWLTVRQGTAGGAVLGCGTTPLNVTTTTTGPIYLHVNTNSSCGVQSSCRATTITCLSCTTLSAPVGSGEALAGEALNLPEGDLFVGNVFPNPLSGNTANIRVESPKETEAIVRFMDQMGREVMAMESDLFVGENLLQLNIGRLPAGTYFVMIQVEGRVIPRRLVIPRA